MAEVIFKTSEEWSKQFDYEVVNPKGWGIRNFRFSWYEEEITACEYIARLSRSKIISKKRG